MLRYINANAFRFCNARKFGGTAAARQAWMVLRAVQLIGFWRSVFRSRLSVQKVSPEMQIRYFCVFVLAVPFVAARCAHTKMHGCALPPVFPAVKQKVNARHKETLA